MIRLVPMRPRFLPARGAGGGAAQYRLLPSTAKVWAMVCTARS